MPRFVHLWWHDRALYGGFEGDGPFIEWLTGAAPDGYRLAAVIVHEPWAGRPEDPQRRECIFERVAS